MARWQRPLTRRERGLTYAGYGTAAVIEAALAFADAFRHEITQAALAGTIACIAALSILVVRRQDQLNR